MTLDATFVAGDDVTITITVTDQDGAAINLTGATIEWGLFDPVTKASVLSKSTTDFTVSITDAVGGKFTVIIDDTDTTAISGNFIHEAKITDSSGDISRVRDLTLNPGDIVFKAKLIT